MIILLNTSTPTCQLSIVSAGERIDYEWLAERELAKGLHAFIVEKLKESGYSWSDMTGIGVFRGPGSYTGLRIGLTVANTLAGSLGVPIVGSAGENWQKDAVDGLQAGGNHKVVLPEYGGQANITAPRK